MVVEMHGVAWKSVRCTCPMTTCVPRCCFASWGLDPRSLQLRQKRVVRGRPMVHGCDACGRHPLGWERCKQASAGRRCSTMRRYGSLKRQVSRQMVCICYVHLRQARCWKQALVVLSVSRLHFRFVCHVHLLAILLCQSTRTFPPSAFAPTSRPSIQCRRLSFRRQQGHVGYFLSNHACPPSLELRTFNKVCGLWPKSTLAQSFRSVCRAWFLRS